MNPSSTDRILLAAGAHGERRPPAAALAAEFFNRTLKDDDMNEKQNTALVQQGYQLFSQGDIPGVLKLMSPNVTWVMPKLENVPFTGTFQGPDGVGRFFSALASASDILKFEPREFIAQGNKVVVLGESRYRVKGQKEEFDDKWVDVLTVENGKVARYERYGNTAATERAFRSHAMA